MLPADVSRKRDRRRRDGAGFTVIEMLVVMAVVALMVSIIAPNYARHVDNARETVLKQNLATTRDAIDKFRTDQGRFPASLQELVATRYLRAVPMDPMTDRSDSWTLTPALDGSAGVSDLHSSAQGTALDGTSYAKW